MMNVIILVAILLFSSSCTKSSFSLSEERINIVYNNIIKNNPNINRSYAKDIAIVICKKSKKHNINPIRFSAILAQESSYKMKAKNSATGDFGISQINHKTIKRYKFDKNRLLNDLEYAIEAGMIVLSDFKKRYSHREKHWWSRYNSSNKDKRIAYEKAVMRYL